MNIFKFLNKIALDQVHLYLAINATILWSEVILRFKLKNG